MAQDNPPPTLGSIGWHDLTVPNAEAVRDFYSNVLGWTSQSLSMGDYEDYVMLDSAGNAAGGVCHARGPNADIPPQWLVYVHVEELEARIADVERNGGSVVCAPRSAGGGRMAVVRDPAGAVLGLYESA